MSNKLVDVFVSDDSVTFDFGKSVIPPVYRGLSASGAPIFATDLIGNWRGELAAHRFDDELNGFIEQLATIGCDTIEVFCRKVRLTAAPTAEIGKPAIAAMQQYCDRHPRINYVGGRPVRATSGFQGL